MSADVLRELQAAFHDGAGDWYRNPRGRIACWLWQFDDRHYDCAGRLEGIHLLKRQRVEERLAYQLDVPIPLLRGANKGASLRRVDPSVVERIHLIWLAAWDPRNAAVGCTRHHRRFDSQATPPLRVPAHALRREALDFVLERGLEVEAERKFTGNVELALALPSPRSNPSTPTGSFQPARAQSGLIAAGQPSAL